jgi:hypothetical protein
MVMCWKMLVGRLENTGLGMEEMSLNISTGCGAGSRSGSSPFKDLGHPTPNMPINCSLCRSIRLSVCLPFRPSGKTLYFLHFFPAKTGTTPAKALTERRARKARGGAA